MRIQLSGGMKCGVIPAVILILALGAGCGGDNGGEPEPEPQPDCAISGVNTSLIDSWQSGENVSIRWTHNGVPGTVEIELLKAGAVVQTIATGTANDGFHPWIAATGGQPNGSDFSIRVTGTGEAVCSDQIDGLTIIDVAGCSFTFTAEITEEASAGVPFDITWTSVNTSGMVDIELWTAAFGDQVDERVGVIALDAPDNGLFTWTLDSFNNSGDDVYRYVIRDPNVSGCEAVSEKFRLFDNEICSISVRGPTAGQIYDLGDPMPLQIDQNNGNQVVNLRLYTGNEPVPFGNIADNVSVVRDTTWTVADFNHDGARNRYRVKAFDAIDGYCTGESESFTINP